MSPKVIIHLNDIYKHCDDICECNLTMSIALSGIKKHASREALLLAFG